MLSFFPQKHQITTKKHINISRHKHPRRARVRLPVCLKSAEQNTVKYEIDELGRAFILDRPRGLLFVLGIFSHGA